MCDEWILKIGNMSLRPVHRISWKSDPKANFSLKISFLLRLHSLICNLSSHPISNDGNFEIFLESWSVARKGRRKLEWIFRRHRMSSFYQRTLAGIEIRVSILNLFIKKTKTSKGIDRIFWNHGVNFTFALKKYVPCERIMNPFDVMIHEWIIYPYTLLSNFCKIILIFKTGIKFCFRACGMTSSCNIKHFNSPYW